MGSINLARLPEYLDRWKVRYELHGDWLNVGRASGGFDSIMGITVHHSASPSNANLNNVVAWALNAPDAPIGNGTLSRDKDGPKLVMYAGMASNTAGKGGPVLSSRGVIPQDAANRVTVAFEAENNGSGEPWSDAMCDLYIATVCATLQWANDHTPGNPLGPGDVWAHFEWAPTRKIDPFGPCRWNDQTKTKWNMDRFRGEVFAALVGAPPEQPMAQGIPVAPIGYTGTGPEVGNLQDVLRFWQWLTCEDERWVYGDCTWQGVVNMQLALGVPADGEYNQQTMRAYSDFIIAMQTVSCAMPAPSTLGDSGDEVVKLQTFLNSNHWYTARIDGQYGPLTQIAVQQMQRYAKGEQVYTGPVHGIYDTATRDALCQLI